MKLNIQKWFDRLVLGLMAFLTHITIFVCYLEALSPKRFCTYGSVQSQLSCLLFIALLVLLVLRLNGWERYFLMRWRKNWLLAGFVLFALLSLFWSIYLPATIYRMSLLIFVSFIASYIGFRFSVKDLVGYIAITTSVFGILSLIFVIFLPGAGIMDNAPYVGLWRGVFWHKIYLGAMMALGYISWMIIIFSSKSNFKLIHKILAGIMLILGLILAVKSDSASGLVVIVAQTIIFALILSWIKFGHSLSRRHYYVLFAIFLLVVILLVINLDLVFGAFNRSSTLTGRVPMWLYVIDHFGAKRPLFGYGFGAFWLQTGINQSVQKAVDWGYPVKVSDNGFLDIFLGLGGVGLLMLIFILTTGFIRAMKVAIKNRDLISFFPFLLLVHIALINISLSYFMEMEIFIWFVLVVIFFIQTSPSSTDPFPYDEN